MLLKFGEWAPDTPDFNTSDNPQVALAQNCLGAGAAYLPFPSLAVYSSALTARCQGAYGSKDFAGNTTNFAGDASKLYKLAGSTYSDVSQLGGYSTGAEERWWFTQMGNRVMATNYANNIQSWIHGTSSAWADLDASAPKARTITICNNFVVVGNTNDGTDGQVPYRVRWSGLNQPTSWTVSATTQADYNDMEASKGWVQRVVGGQYGTIFQERAISIMTYVGSPEIFQIREVESQRGTPAPGSVIKVGNFIAYLGQDGFYIFDGSQSIPIGENKINKFFWSDVDQNYLSRICAALDYSKQIIYWAYPASGNTSGRPNKILCYNYAPNTLNRWTIITGIDIELLFNSFAVGFTLDQLDPFGTLETLTFPLDSRVWTGNSILLSAFDSSHKQNNFTGSSMAAQFDTQEGEPFEGQYSNITRLRPLIDGGGTITVQVGTRNRLIDSVSFGSSISDNGQGDYLSRVNARYVRGRVTVAGGFNYAQGIEIIEASPGSKR